MEEKIMELQTEIKSIRKRNSGNAIAIIVLGVSLILRELLWCINI